MLSFGGVIQLLWSSSKPPQWEEPLPKVWFRWQKRAMRLKGKANYLLILGKENRQIDSFWVKMTARVSLSFF